MASEADAMPNPTRGAKVDFQAAEFGVTRKPVMSVEGRSIRKLNRTRKLLTRPCFDLPGGSEANVGATTGPLSMACRVLTYPAGSHAFRV